MYVDQSIYFNIYSNLMTNNYYADGHKLTDDT